MTMRAILTAAIAALALAATPVLAKDLHPKPHKPHVTRNAANCATTHTCHADAEHPRPGRRQRPDARRGLHRRNDGGEQHMTLRAILCGSRQSGGGDRTHGQGLVGDTLDGTGI